ncbi:hypothetical protein [Vibrio methylphosphonaticus]|uniref:hypothetical protein n=1 Tax=Vibrio methylphosphonaticus TaxID=2946866 RepID=UPI00202A9981|nr:hypothetical protein [Vibrio methylphosphonaticus]MCL9776858.1 hypothetical protein [Vibrio methylphosphonaticus]
MKLFKKIIVSIATIALFPSIATAQDFGVELKWNTQDIYQVLETMPKQKQAFEAFVDSGRVKDMFVTDSKIGEENTPLLRFVMEGDSEADIRAELAQLPLYQANLVKIGRVQAMGNKWLDTTPQDNHYGLTLTWKSGIEPMEIDRVLGVDLQRVIALNQVGTVSSSYINTQTLEGNVVRPVYLVSVLAKDAEQALEMSKQFEAIRLGYASVDVEHLGRKLDMTKL